LQRSNRYPMRIRWSTGNGYCGTELADGNYTGGKFRRQLPETNVSIVSQGRVNR
jgi:hypothetical protein